MSGGVVAAGAVSWHSLLFSPMNPVVTRREVTLKGLPRAFAGLRIVQLSDLHFSPLVPRAYLEKCVRLANALEPDLIFLTGDYVTRERGVPREETIRRYVEPLPEILGGIRARAGRFAVLGNHDTAVGPRAVTRALQDSGFQVLRNDRVALTHGGARLPLVGLADYGTEYVDQRRAFAGIPPDEPAMILMHNPDLFRAGMQHRNGLVLAGHTHGGQIVLPFYGPLYVPSIYDADFLAGRFQENDLTMLVNRGVGMIHYPIRFNCRPEITQVTLL